MQPAHALGVPAAHEHREGMDAASATVIVRRSPAASKGRRDRPNQVFRARGPPPYSVEDLLMNPRRKAMVEAVAARPGIHLTALQRQTGMGWGTLQHHLRMLESTRLIARVSLGRSVHLFLGGIQAGDTRQLAVLTNDLSRRVAGEVVRKPGLIQSDLCKSLSISRKLLGHHTRLLEAAGLLRVARTRLKRRYVPTADLIRLMVPGTGSTPGRSPPPAPCPPQ